MADAASIAAIAQAIQAAVAAGVTQAEELQEQARTAAAAVAVAAPFALTPGAAAPSEPINYATSEGIKLYASSILPIHPTFKGDNTDLRACLDALEQRAEDFGWKEILTISVDGIDRQLTKHYGIIPLEDCQESAKNYIGTSSRKAQASKQLANCLRASIAPELATKMLGESKDYNIDSTVDGTCFLKVLLNCSTIATRAICASTRIILQNLPTVLEKNDYDVDKFNREVGKHNETLNSNNSPSTDLLTNLFRGYLSHNDPDFVEYIKTQELKWEDGKDDDEGEITPDRLMKSALARYNTIQVKNGTNGSHGPRGKAKDDGVIALAAQFQSAIQALTALKATIGHEANPSGKKKQKGLKDSKKWAWKTVAPKPGEAKTKKFDGKDYVFCPYHDETKWVLATNHANGCRNAQGGAQPADGDANGKEGPKKQKNLQYMRALMNAMDMVDEDEEEVPENN